MDNKDKNDYKELLFRTKQKALQMAYLASESGNRPHIGGALSCMEIMAVLYKHVLRYEAANMESEERDFFFASKAHCILAQYTIMAECGIIPSSELDTYLDDGSPLVGYPKDTLRGLEYAGGSLGMTFSYAVGVALKLKTSGKKNRVYVLVGDGECDEGIIWEAAMCAANYSLDNLVLIVDRNHVQLDGKTEDVMDVGSLYIKLESFNWFAQTVDGHDVEELISAFDNTVAGKPNAIIAETVKGNGISFMEGQKEWHQMPITKEQYQQAINELAGDDYVQI